jgi:hypothetical protein
MIELWGLIAAAVVLLLLLMAVATKGWLASRELQETALAPNELDAAEPCPEEFVSRVFSRSDWEFVHGLKATSIERLFERERKKLALIWVRQTSAMIRKVMHEHAEAARQSKNLEFATEINLLAQFLTLMALCGILSLAVRIAGPLWLGGLAHFAQRLSQQVTNLQESFQAGVLAKAGGAGPA